MAKRFETDDDFIYYRATPGLSRRDRSSVLRAAGRAKAAWRLIACGEREMRCGSRLCDRCNTRWVYRMTARLTPRLQQLGDAPLFVTLMAPAGSAREAERRLRMNLKRFRRRTSFPFVGCVHLVRGGHGGWLAHAHLVVAANEGVQEEIRAAWPEVRPDGAPWSEIAERPTDALGYALRGAVKVPVTRRWAFEWHEALRGRRLVLWRDRKVPTTEEIVNVETATPRRALQTQRLAQRLCEILSEGPMGRAAIAKRVNSSSRGLLGEALNSIMATGAVRPIASNRGSQLCLAEHLRALWVSTRGAKRQP